MGDDNEYRNLLGALVLTFLGAILLFTLAGLIHGLAVGKEGIEKAHQEIAEQCCRECHGN